MMRVPKKKAAPERGYQTLSCVVRRRALLPGAPDQTGNVNKDQEDHTVTKKKEQPVEALAEEPKAKQQTVEALTEKPKAKPKKQAKKKVSAKSKGKRK